MVVVWLVFLGVVEKFVCVGVCIFVEIMVLSRFIFVVYVVGVKGRREGKSIFIYGGNKVKIVRCYILVIYFLVYFEIIGVR